MIDQTQATKMWGLEQGQTYFTVIWKLIKSVNCTCRQVLPLMNIIVFIVIACFPLLAFSQTCFYSFWPVSTLQNINGNIKPRCSVSYTLLSHTRIGINLLQYLDMPSKDYTGSVISLQSTSNLFSDVHSSQKKCRANRIIIVSSLSGEFPNQMWYK